MGKMIKITLLLASTLTVMAGAAIAPALPTISQFFSHVPHVDLLTKLLLTLPALFIALFSPVVGYLIDRLGKLLLFQLSMVLYIIAGTSGFFLSSLPMLLISRAFLGIAVAGIMTTAVTLAGDYYEGQERSRFLGTQAAVMAFGGTVFVSCSGLLADMGWRFPFLIYLMALPVLVLVNRFLPEPENLNPAKGAPGGQVSENLPVRTLMLIYTTIFLGMAAFYVIPVQSPFLLEQIGANRPSLQSVGLIGATIMAAIFSQSYASIAHRLGTRGVFALGFSLMAVGFAVTSLAHEYVQAVVGLFLAGGGGGLLMPNANTWLMKITPAAMRGRIMGAMTMAVFFGQFCSPILFEPIAKIQGLQGAHLTAGALLLIVGISYTVSIILKRTDLKMSARNSG